LKSRAPRAGARSALAKTPTGIEGFDEITEGGVPRGRTTLVCGGPGCGKTLFATEFLVRGATQFGENGAFISFEETSEELAQNVRSLGFDLEALIKDEKIAMDHIRIERSEIEQTGDYDLEGLFLRLGLAIDSVGAKRVVLDTVESLFGGFDNVALLRAELRRLFRFLKDKGVSVVLTGERGEGALTRQGLEEYVSDCVILLDHRVTEQVSTRRLRIVKYRGTTHGTNEYPFLIDSDGISVLPITSMGLDHAVSNERVSTGVPGLDAMLGGKGYFRGSSILISGTAGTGKSSLAAAFARETCSRGEKCLYLAFEESPAQILRNMKSIALDLEPHVKKGLLRIHASRPALHGLEQHLVGIHKMVEKFQPASVVVDPISNLISAGSQFETEAMLLRLVDFLKTRQITALMTHLNAGTQGRAIVEATDVGISSIVDTWLLVRDIELGGERNRAMYVLKSRGMQHSNQVREFLLTSRGINLLDVYIGAEGVLTGSMRAAQEAREKAMSLAQRHEMELKQRDLDRRRAAIEAQINSLRAEFEAVQTEARIAQEQDRAREQTIAEARVAAAKRRGAEENSRRGKGK